MVGANRDNTLVGKFIDLVCKMIFSGYLLFVVWNSSDECIHTLYGSDCMLEGPSKEVISSVNCFSTHYLLRENFFNSKKTVIQVKENKSFHKLCLVLAVMGQ